MESEQVVRNLWAMARSGSPATVEMGRQLAASVGCPALEYEDAIPRCGCGDQSCLMGPRDSVCECPFCGIAMSGDHFFFEECKQCAMMYDHGFAGIDMTMYDFVQTVTVKKQRRGLLV